MPWFRKESTFARHRKNRRLARILDIPLYAARGLVDGLLCQVCAEEPDGNISDWDAVDVAYACDWDGDPARLYDALVEVVFIVKTANGTEINDWMEYAEGYKEALRAKKNREKKKLVREKDGVTDASRTRTVRVPDASCTRTRDRTGPDQTGPTKEICTKSDPPADKSLPVATDADASAVSVDNGKGRGQGRAIDDPRSARDDVQEIWAHYRTHHPGTAKALKSNRKEYQLIKARLQDFDVDTLKQAIDGYHKSPFHTGQNDRGTKYLALTLIMRSISHVQAGVEMLSSNGKGGVFGAGGPRPLDLTLLASHTGG